MNKEELIGKLQMVYVGERNALNELIGYYDGLKQGIEELQQENKQLKEKIKYQKNKIDNKDNWCQLIVDIGFDYDGCNTIESLKGLIDELVRYALNSRDNYDYEEMLKEVE